MSLMAGLVFGGISAYGAYNITNDSKDIKISLCEYAQVQFKMNFQRIINIIQLVLCLNVSILPVASGLLAVVMGMRYKKSGKLMPAGVISGIR